MMVFIKPLSVQVLEGIYNFHKYGPYSAEALRELTNSLPKAAMSALCAIYSPVRIARSTVYEPVSNFDAKISNGGAVINTELPMSSML